MKVEEAMFVIKSGPMQCPGWTAASKCPTMYGEETVVCRVPASFGRGLVNEVEGVQKGKGGLMIQADSSIMSLSGSPGPMTEMLGPDPSWWCCAGSATLIIKIKHRAASARHMNL